MDTGARLSSAMTWTEKPGAHVRRRGKEMERDGLMLMYTVDWMRDTEFFIYSTAEV